LSLSACPGVGNRPPSKKKIANPRGCARGGMVTGRIEPCITAVVHKNQRYVLKPTTSVMHARGSKECVEEELLEEGVNTLVIGGCTTTKLCAS